MSNSDNNTLNKVLTVITYFLVIVLICLILYNLILLINRTYSSNRTPTNSIKVGPIALEVNHWSFYSQSIY